MESLRLSAAPARQTFLERREVGESRIDPGKIGDQLIESGNHTPGGHSENLEGVRRFNPELLILTVGSLPHRLRPVLQRSGFLNLVSIHPREPFRNL